MKRIHFLKMILAGIATVAFPINARADIYEVKERENLSVVAARHFKGRAVWGPKGSVAQLLRQNPQIKNKNLIHPGDRLIIIPEESVTSSTKTKPKKQPSPHEEPAKEKDSTPVQAPDPLVAKVEAPAQEPPPAETTTISAPPSADSESKSHGLFELSPFFAMESIHSTDVSSGTQDTIASNLFFGLDTRYSQVWNESTQSYIRAKFASISFTPPARSSQALVDSSKFLTTFGLGSSKSFSNGLKFELAFDLERNLFLRAASSTSVTTDSVLTPSFGAKVTYDFYQLNSLIFDASLVYEEKLKATTATYNVGLGSLYGGIIEVRQHDQGEDRFAVSLGYTNRTQNTNFTNQGETIYLLAVRVFLPVGKTAPKDDVPK